MNESDGEREALNVLREYAALEELQQKANAIAFAGPQSSFGEKWGEEHHRLRKEYVQRKHAADAAARAALSSDREMASIAGDAAPAKTITGDTNQGTLMNAPQTQPNPAPIRPQHSDILELEVWSRVPPMTSEEKLDIAAEIERRFYK